MSHTISPDRTMNLTELQREAELQAVKLEIDWERASSFENKQYFEEKLARSTNDIPKLESLYLKLTNGQSVAFNDTVSPLSFLEQERYAAQVADRLFTCYVIREVLHKYQCITNIMNLAYPQDTPYEN